MHAALSVQLSVRMAEDGHILLASSDELPIASHVTTHINSKS